MIQTPWKIRVISLESDEQRRRPLIEALDQLGLEYEIVPGVDGRNGLPAVWESQIDRATAERRKHRPLSDGEFACALSHRNVCQMILDNGEDGGIILEDDAIVGPGFAEFVRSGAYRDHSMLMLDYGPVFLGRATVPLYGDIVARPVMFSPNLATGYTVRKDCASALVEAATPVRFVADWPCELRDLSTHVVVPRLVDHPEKGKVSTLEGERRRLKAVQKARPKARYLTRSYWRNWLLKRRSSRFRTVPFRP
ncbi:glycosyltransferase family 25 protein [Celeribacter indicus]|uniref:Glycosyl transferase n=1 Tax=Celeribacter indicus TaxID=1208324 RepID=A0A0B5DRU9_9RHOB|nr:glycosyltransferase family 25 protein [Celeribacter indicus]AJE46253.1 glycosyl transferase [Celeribacter indicus]SDW51209.1 glycosyl transferase, family 25 [Celeribacter indicus]